MFKITKAFLELFQDEVFLDDGKHRVPVIVREFPQNKIPCITIHQTGTSNTLNRRRYVHSPLEYIQLEKDATVNINLWSSSLETLDKLENNVTRILLETLSNNYHRCSHYHRTKLVDDELKKGYCDTLQDTCPAPNHSKQQCPNKKEYDYTSFFKKNHIRKNTFHFEEIASREEYGASPAIFHTEYIITFTYNEYHPIGGKIAENFKIGDLI